VCDVTCCSLLATCGELLSKTRLIIISLLAPNSVKFKQVLRYRVPHSDCLLLDHAMDDWIMLINSLGSIVALKAAGEHSLKVKFHFLPSQVTTFQFCSRALDKRSL